MLKKILLLASIAGALGIVLSGVADATPEIAKKEEKSCLTCHTALGKADLNTAGKYYKEHRKLPKKPGLLR